MKTSNYRMLAYTLLAVGLINWDYQRSHKNIFPIVLVALICGILLLGSTFLKRFPSIGENKFFMFFTLLVGVLVIGIEIWV